MKEVRTAKILVERFHQQASLRGLHAVTNAALYPIAAGTELDLDPLPE